MIASTETKTKSLESAGALVPLLVVFLATAAAAVALCVAGALTTADYRSALEIENTYAFLMAGELFFFIFLWPLMGAGRRAVSMPVLAVLLALSAPLVTVAAYVSNTSGATILLTHLLLVVIAAAVIAASGVLREKDQRFWSYYFLAATGACGMLPLVQFLLQDMFGAGIRWLSALSPFWAMQLAQQPGPDIRKYWAGAILVFAAVALAVRLADGMMRTRE